ncbi:stage II sporulation protein P [Ruminococcaceae bacterium FB2012]|nr:stage II sporulation protein P [Ruminococcaceae bacterium FB2012]
MERRKTVLRSAGVVAGLVVVPLAVWGFSFAAPVLSGITASGAMLSMGSVTHGKVTSGGSAMLIRAPVSSGCRDLEAAPEEVQLRSPVPVEIASAKPDPEIIAAVPYPEDLNSRDGVIQKMNFGHYDGTQYFDLDGGGQVRNGSDEWDNASLYAESKKSPDFSFQTSEGQPLVLIYHTHTTESYEPSDRDFYDASFQSRTTDPSKSVVAVGDRICAELEKAGIPYIHDTLLHDYVSYNEAYDSSRTTVKELLAKYPSIKIALDIHRDGLQREDGTRLSPVAEIAGRDAAQIMIISGCDDGSLGLPEYIKNFHFACALQQQLESSCPGLTRPILFDYRHYNQDLTTGSLLIEVGSHGNCLEQALYSGELVGRGLAELIKSSP